MLILFCKAPNDYISEQYNKQFVNDMVLEDVGSKTIEAKRSTYNNVNLEQYLQQI